MTGTTAYCTILSTNYLPKALALADSLARFYGGKGGYWEDTGAYAWYAGI